MSKTTEKKLSKKILVLGVITVLVISLAALMVENIPVPESERKGLGWRLIPPPAYATDYGDPIDTSSIGFMAYYYLEGGFTLIETAGAFLNYTDNSSYYDGYIRCYQEGSGTVFEALWDATPWYIDCSVRVRSDGWVLAWMDNSAASYTQSVHWGLSRMNSYSDSYFKAPSENYVLPMRALDKIFYVAGLDAPGGSNYFIYDYGHSTATKLAVFGLGDNTLSTGNHYWYSLFPSTENSAIVDAYTCIVYYQSASASNQFVSVGGSTVWVANNTYGVTTGIDCSGVNCSGLYSLDVQAQHNSYWNSGTYTYNNAACLVWLN